MKEQDFTQIIHRHEKLERLLSDQDVGTLTDFKEEEFQTEGFKEYIQDDYLNSILMIIKNHLGTKKDGKVIAAMRSLQYLATEETKNTIATRIEPFLIEVIKGMKSLNNMVDANLDEIEIATKVEEFGRSLGNGIMSFFNYLDKHPIVATYKEEYIKVSMMILEKVAYANPKRQSNKYFVFDLLMRKIDKIKDFGAYQEQFHFFQDKKKKKSKELDIRYVIGIIIAIIIIIIKLLK